MRTGPGRLRYASSAKRKINFTQDVGRNFLVTTHGLDLQPDSAIDISHESLIRQWRRLGGWVKDERKSAASYLQLADTARRWKAGEAGLWGRPDLDIALKWRKKESPTAAWAERYDPDFDLAMEFLDASKRARTKKIVGTVATVGGIMLLLAGFGLYANNQKGIAEDALDRADNDRRLAETQRAEAVEQRAAAEKATKEANERKLQLEESNAVRGRTWQRHADSHLVSRRLGHRPGS